MKNLADKFAEVEKRVKSIVAENAVLKKRAAELEQELATVRRESQEIEDLHGRKTEIREKIERVLHALETVGGTKSGPGGSTPHKHED